MNVFHILDVIFHVVGILLCGVIANESFHDPDGRDNWHIDAIGAGAVTVAVIGIVTVFLK